MKIATIYTVLMIVIVLLLGFAIYGFCVQRMVESEKNLMQRGQLQTMNLIDSRLGTFLTKSQILFSNAELQEALSKQYDVADSSETYFAYQNRIYSIITPVTQDFFFPDYSLAESDPGSIASNTKFMIYLDNQTLTKDGGTILDFNTVRDELWVRNTMLAPNGIYWESNIIKNNITYVALNRTVKYIARKKDLGVMSFLIPKALFNSIINKGNTDEEVQWALLDTEGVIVISDSTVMQANGDALNIQESSGKNAISEISVKGKRFICSTVSSRINGWTLISLYPYDSVAKKLNSVFLLVLIVMLVAALISMGTSRLIANVMTKRLDSIMCNMECIKKDRKAMLADVPGNDEIGQLNVAFRDMVSNLNNLVDREKQHQRQSNAMRVELLMSQMNPHILYNTLATIGWVAKKSGLTELERVLDLMIRFFKNFLNRGSLITTLQHEIDMIQQYVSILRFTYQLDFEVQTDIEDEIGKYACLNLVLQPIVENAIIHGIKPARRPGRLSIFGRLEGGDIVFTISDNGIGMPQDSIDALMSGSTASKTGGYGLSNVMQRIRLYYGGEYGVCFASQDGEGTAVTVRMPVFAVEELQSIVSDVI